FRLDPHAVVLLLFQQEGLQSFRILRRQLYVAQHHLFHHDSIRCQLLRDQPRCPPPHFLTLRRKNIPHRVVRNDLPPNARDDRRDAFFFHWTRQTSMDVIQPLRIEPVSHGSREPQRQSFFP